MSLVEIIKESLNSSVKRLVHLVVVSAIGSISSFAAGCGANETEKNCTKDSDCKGDRICDSDLGYCVDANGGSSGSSSGGNPQGYCGNSPLYEKYLWKVGNCKLGSKKPFGKDCKSYIFGKDGVEDVCTYNGLTIDCDGEPDYTLILTRDLFCYNVISTELCDKIQCAIQHDSNIYTREGHINSNSSLYAFRPVSWPGEDACWTQIKTEEWYNSCF